MIVGSAGHVDHGKTTLVRALTGSDTDRLPEKRRRGIPIEIGYAYAGKLGFVDVPGHERLVHTLLPGRPPAALFAALLVPVGLTRRDGEERRVRAERAGLFGAA